MATIVTRSGKGSPLTNNEVDANFTNLNTELGTKVNASSLAAVATSGAYADLSGRPTNVSSFTNDSGYLTSFTEADPTVPSHVKAITTTNISNWNTAFGWGNHASAGYLTGITSGQITTALGFTPATAAQGAKADTAVQTITSTDGSISITGTTAIDLSVAVAGSTSNVLLPVRNTTGATLTKGTAVYISGATGQISTVSKAIATSDATSAQTLGLVTANIANNANGNVTLIGTITNIDTSAYTDGQQLYLSPTTAGTLTATKPYAPNHLVYMAVVEHAHPTQGKLFVKVQNGYEMDELHDVSAQSPANNDGLFFNTSTSLWEKKSIVTALGYTPYNATNPAGYITSSALTPYALLSGAAFTGNVTTTGNVGIGTTASSDRLNVSGSGQFTNATYCFVGVTSGTVQGQFAANAGGTLDIRAVSNHPMTFFTNNTERMRITSAGDVGIGTSAPAGKFHIVTGTNDSLLFRGPISLGTGGSIFAVNAANSAIAPMEFAASVFYFNAGNVGIGTTSPNAKFQSNAGSSQVAVMAGGTVNSPSYPAFGFDGQIASNGGRGAGMYLPSDGTLAWSTSATERMRIDSSGNVGIGVTSPSALLHLNKASGAADLRLSVGGTLYSNIYASSSDVNILGITAIPLILGTNNTERMRILSGGDVGIGTSTPAAKLEVNGGLIAGAENRQSHPPTGPVGFKAQWNYTGGDGETDFYNLYSIASTSFRFYQTTGSGTAQLLYNMRPTTHEFYTGGTLRFSITSTGGITSSDLADAVGYKGLPQNQRTSAYTLALSDIGKHLYVTAGAFAVTIPADGTLNFPVGATMSFVCEDAAKTIVPASGVTLVLAGTGAATTGTRTLAIGAVATLIKVQANRWYISGSGVT